MKAVPLSVFAFALLNSPVALAVDGPPVTADQKTAAQKMFEAGDALYESERYADAAEAFRKSHGLVGSPNSRLMLARSLRELGRREEAIVEYRATIEDASASGGRYAEAQQAAASELEALTSEPVKPTVEPPQASPASPAPVQQQEPVASPKATAFTESKHDSLRPYAWIAAGAGAVGLTGFAVFGYLDRKTFRELEADCSDGQCDRNPDDRIARGETYQLCANLGLLLAVTGAATATTLFVLSSGSKSESQQLSLSVAPARVSLEARF